MSVAENIKNVRERMNAACLRAGRDPKEVTLISVSKTKPVSMLMEAYEAGERDFGENKVQEITEKRPQIPEDARFHMIGHLQDLLVNINSLSVLPESEQTVALFLLIFQCRQFP